jgi:serine/threonine-protein kinase
MEYLDGEDLDALVRRAGPLPVATAVDLLLQACEAIGEGHALGIVHRDLKPANLFLTHRADGTACVKVLDFGISKAPRRASEPLRTGALATLPSMVMGSPRYMSPEKMTSSAMADERSDVWSLGATLYELVTGRIAFDGPSNIEVCARALEGTPMSVTRLRPDASYELEVTILRCLQKEPSCRYANVAELARALAPFGSVGARASAESIARVVEGGIEGRSPCGETMRPTAAEILAVPTRRRRSSGYLLGSAIVLVALAGLGMRFTERAHLPRSNDVVAVAAAAPTSSSSTWVPATVPPAIPSAMPSTSSPQILPSASSSARRTSPALVAAAAATLRRVTPPHAHPARPPIARAAADIPF